jgi:hypothetical protein
MGKGTSDGNGLVDENTSTSQMLKKIARFHGRTYVAAVLCRKYLSASRYNTKV